MAVLITEKGGPVGTWIPADATDRDASGVLAGPIDIVRNIESRVVPSEA